MTSLCTYEDDLLLPSRKKVKFIEHLIKSTNFKACLLTGFRNNFIISFDNCQVSYVNAYLYVFSSQTMSGIPENVHSFSYMILSLNDLEIAFEGQNKIANSGKQLHHHIESKLLSFS